jgi:ribose 5-phosphate isomerase B
MKLVIGSDHAGFELKEYLKEELEKLGYSVEDKGTFSADSTDYPDYAHLVAETIEKDQDKNGILICGSASGVCMTANKHQGVRAAQCWTPEIASLARQHNNANAVCLPARFIAKELALDIVKAFLNAEFEGGRHERRVNKIACT